MFAQVNKLEIAVLVLHMNTMRQNVKKGLKSTYGKDEGKRVLRVFDEVKEQLEEALDELEADTNQTAIFFELEELVVTRSFFAWYVKELEHTYQATGKSIPEEDQKQLEILKSFTGQLEELKVYE